MSKNKEILKDVQLKNPQNIEVKSELEKSDFAVLAKPCDELASKLPYTQSKKKTKVL